MIKLETHCHTPGASPCADCDFDLAVKKYAAAGYGGVVITNHLSEYSYGRLSGDSHREKINAYFGCYYSAKEKLEKAGLKAFWGVEVRAFCPNGDFSEYMLYGLTERDMYDNPPLYTFTQEELFRLAEKKNAFMYQPHPFRTGLACGNPSFLHGAEAFNGHSTHFNYNALANDFCEKNHIIKMSGTDYHHDFQPVIGGIFVPDGISDEKRLTEFLKNNAFDIIRDETFYERELKKNKEKTC